MTRAQARTLETEVTSLLSDITYDPLETWLLPRSEMLCMIRCQEDPPEDAHEDGQVPKFMEEENQWKESRTASRPRTSGHDPRHPAPEPAAAEPPSTYKPRTSRPSPDIRPKSRKSGTLHPKSVKASPDCPDIRLKPRHPAPREAPDIRPPLSAHSVRAQGPCTPSPTLTIYTLLLPTF